MRKVSPNDLCPCRSDLKYKKCCRPYHVGNPAPTPEAVVRARYSAFTTGTIDYLIETTHPESEQRRKDEAAWRAHLHTTATLYEFPYLEILDVGDDWVEFRIMVAEVEDEHNDYDPPFNIIDERSFFEQLDGRWYYVGSEMLEDHDSDAPI